MHSKTPALVVCCAAATCLSLGVVEADDRKKKDSVESRKTEPAKKKPSKKPDPQRVQITKLNEQLAENRREIGKLRDSLHTAQKELAAKAMAIKTLESGLAAREESLKKCESGKKKAESDLKRARGDLVMVEDALKKTNDSQRKTAAELKATAEELKKKSEALAKAEGQLKDFRRIDFNKLAQSLDNERKRYAALQKQFKELEAKAREDLVKANARLAAATRNPSAQKKPEPKKPASKKPQSKAPKAKTPTVAPVIYEHNSAVNLKERDRVLGQLRAILKRSPKTEIQLTGYADDSPYQETNRDVAANRANFLGRYLVLKGLPEDRITCRAVGSSRQGRGAGNRKVVIQIKN